MDSANTIFLMGLIVGGIVGLVVGASMRKSNDIVPKNKCNHCNNDAEAGSVVCSDHWYYEAKVK